MKSQDIVILLKLVSLQEQGGSRRLKGTLWLSEGEEAHSVRGLGASLGISKTEVSASIRRSLKSGLAVKDRELERPKPNRRNLYEFIVHGLKFVFPVKPGPVSRGIPTGFAAWMLKDQLMTAGKDIFVWPHAEGTDRGQSVEPLFRSVPDAAQRDERLYEYLALIDALRLGRQRESNLAVDRLKYRLLGG